MTTKLGDVQGASFIICSLCIKISLTIYFFFLKKILLNVKPSKLFVIYSIDCLVYCTLIAEAVLVIYTMRLL